MPRKTKTPAPKNKPQSKTAFVLAQPENLPAAEVLAKAKRVGLRLTEGYVYTIRSAARVNRKAGKKRAAAKTAKATTKARPTRRQPAPKSSATKPAARMLTDLASLDLAYAVGRLVETGTTTVAEVLQLASERSSRISALEADLAALKAGALPPSPVPPKASKAKPRRRPAKAPRPKAIAQATPKPAVKAPAPQAITKAQPKPAEAPPLEPVAIVPPSPPKAPAPKPIKKTVAKATKKAPGKKGKVITRSDGRKFTMTPKAAAARKLQGTYLGFLRKVAATEKPKFKAIAKSKGVAAAVDALKKRLGDR